jgi:hypothetical protein
MKTLADQALRDLNRLAPTLMPILTKTDGVAELTELLPKMFTLADVSTENGIGAWHISGVYLEYSNRIYDALAVYWGLYLQMLEAQRGSVRIHKGTPLVRISDCFSKLGYSVHGKRYLMLTLCEDALTSNGVISPTQTGVYFRLVWQYGLTDSELKRYAKQFYELGQSLPLDAIFPEALLQRVDDNWFSEYSTPNEASAYRINPAYAGHLLNKIGEPTRNTLELLAEYLMSCMPGCRTRRRARTPSSDYDIVCAMEGFDLDYRSELGRYFVCECKDWENPADFTVMAKFCRILDSTKSRFGIIFSKTGIIGVAGTKDAAREQLKVFQDRGIVIVVLNLTDLERVRSGENLITLLRSKYESIRLDLLPENAKQNANKKSSRVQ